MMEEEDCINIMESRSSGIVGKDSTECVSPPEASITSSPGAAKDAIKSI